MRATLHLLNRQKASQNISCKITEYNIFKMVNGILVNNKNIWLLVGSSGNIVFHIYLTVYSVGTFGDT
jgi:hypothetical protein